ncbi:MAG TPA: DUF465 domain-containing protein [Devosia sp.]|nr:DUF465 domain-containing protein [Devosia sp.]
MTTESHISALERRHRDLDHQLEEELGHASHDDLIVQELKRKKLEIKDQLARLRSSEAA